MPRTVTNVCAAWRCMAPPMRDLLASLPIPTRLLAALLVLLCLLMAPHAANLDPAVMAFFYFAASWRFAALRRARWLPGRWLLLLLMMVAIGLVLGSTGLGDGRRAGSALLVVMLGLKLLELRARRDIHVTVFLGYFLVMTHFLYDQSLWLALYLFSGVLALAVIQVGLNRVAVDLRRQIGQTIPMVAAAVPLALVVFLLFPRLHSPLWAIASDAGVTGISDDIAVGDIGRLSRSQAIALRVRFFGAEPEAAQRYWRGPVLWQTDGRRWRAGRSPEPALPAATGEPRFDYELTLEPTGKYWLFGLDYVTGPGDRTLLNSDHSLVADQPVQQRSTYRAASDPQARPRLLGPGERQLGLQLPAEVSPRVQSLVSGWLQQTDTADPLHLVEQALALFATQPFVYTLDPGRYGDDPVDEFLFERRRGFCEHYATSFVVLMRVAGIPARVVAGYQGGERNPHADHWVIRQSDAHAWAEVWIPSRGWWRVDPTAAVAPQRIEQPIDPALSGDDGQVVFRSEDLGLLGGLWRDAVWIADAVDVGWRRWVVGFTAQRQTSLLESLGLDQLRGLGIGIAMLVGAGLAGGLVYLVARWPRRTGGDPLPALWQRLRVKLARAGLSTEPWQGADTVCGLAVRRFPAAAGQLRAINRLYVQLRYGRQIDARQIRALRARIRDLRLG